MVGIPSIGTSPYVAIASETLPLVGRAKESAERPFEGCRPCGCRVQSRSFTAETIVPGSVGGGSASLKLPQPEALYRRLP